MKTYTFYRRFLNQIIFIYNWLLGWVTRNNYPSQPCTLLEIIDDSRRSWQEALNEFNLCETELVDYLTFKINATERRFIALLRQAQHEGLVAWSAEMLSPIHVSTEN